MTNQLVKLANYPDIGTSYLQILYFCILVIFCKLVFITFKIIRKPLTVIYFYFVETECIDLIRTNPCGFNPYYRYISHFCMSSVLDFFYLVVSTAIKCILEEAVSCTWYEVCNPKQLKRIMLLLIISIASSEQMFFCRRYTYRRNSLPKYRL